MSDTCQKFKKMGVICLLNKNLVTNVLEQSTRTSRGCLSSNRTKLMKDAMIFKYKLTDSLVIDEKWLKIREAVNSKGRTLLNINFNRDT